MKSRLRLFVLAVVCALALMSLPVDDLAVGSAAAVVCEPDDVGCYAKQLRCIIRPIIFGGSCRA